MNIKKLEFHRLADEFPLCTTDEARELAADIKKHGLLEPIVTYEGKILDGRNRYRAAREVGYSLQPDDVVQFEEFYPEDDPLLFVFSKNMHRRHLTIGQRAAVAQNLADRLWEAGKKSERAELVKASEIDAKEAAATGSNVDAVQTFRQLKKEAPELAAEVKTGETPLHTAVKEQKQQKEAKAAAKKISGREIDAALDRIGSVCGKPFLGAITDDGADTAPALRTPGGIMEFAACSEDEMRSLIGPLWAGMTMREAQKFNNGKRKREPTLDWTAREFLALVGPEETRRFGRKLDTPRGAIAIQLLFRSSQAELKKAEAAANNGEQE
jgi:hypothetical protein